MDRGKSSGQDEHISSQQDFPHNRESFEYIDARNNSVIQFHSRRSLHEPKNSPVDIVASTVLTGDDPDIPCLTVRFWIISSSLSLAFSVISQYECLKPADIPNLSFCLVQVFSYGAGKILEKILPRTEIDFMRQRVNLNPGKFNQKEHMLICVAIIAASTASTTILENILSLNIGLLVPLLPNAPKIYMKSQSGMDYQDSL
ncbi:putative oligopeptide transporter [Smittium culicis]|uniref:Putative oligopeptide transporter n=1 Tax=Smittium culicis TaxID=133412 RepID=A0A1R1XVI1_9FUNG|nr:putative oligopeptide transporter [Smittium culicis]